LQQACGIPVEYFDYHKAGQPAFLLQRGHTMTPAVRYLKQIGAKFTLHTYECDVDEDFGKNCANKLHMDEAKVFKTLLIQQDKHLATAIIPVDSRLNLKSAAKALQLKHMTMMPPSDAERVTGYKVGGISPFAQKKQTPILLDDSALLQETILVSGGKRGVSVEIAPQDLVDLMTATVADLKE